VDVDNIGLEVAPIFIFVYPENTNLKLGGVAGISAV